jgi:hydroxymethylbilane synthase
MRRDLDVCDIRGNVDTRIQKMHDGEFAAIVLASAGLHRLGREREITSFLPIEQMTPAAGQGIVAMEVARTRSDVIAAVTEISDRRSEIAQGVERGVLQKFGTLLDCYSCIAVLAEIQGEVLTAHAFVSDLEAERTIRVREEGTVASWESVRDAVYDALLARGAVELLKSS